MFIFNLILKPENASSALEVDVCSFNKRPAVDRVAVAFARLSSDPRADRAKSGTEESKALLSSLPKRYANNI